MADINRPAPGISYFTYEQSTPAGTAIMPQKSGKLIPKLFQPLKIRGVEFQNRVFLSPLAQYSTRDGIVTPWHLAHLGGILTRGPGLTTIEASAVLPEGRTTQEDAGIWSDAHIKPLTQIVERKASTVPLWIAHAPTATKEVGG
ncbi:hypothetical protein NLJ89_g10616 [Agrocybe chaxingu]|uniref:NADH:flavin oxidoreductase/NADH oxidase N-terminal domain-containing protein n=1 Tax=Agrocybe chaxingu TaxID=84603 RepID=A0A9W8MQR5_9AGAR|nr:hypothetical protein NLJ89_g10616 [Agrocybe chaxingu]